MSSSRIALVDCNNFFVSCERVFRPDLKDVPVLVLSSNDGCVVARSQEVKDIGIPMGVPYFQIKDIIKDKGIQVFSGNITLYRDFSRRVFQLVREHSDCVEQYSIDEAFFTLSVGREAELEQQLVALRSRVYHEVGIPVSIGVGFSKTQAKAAATVAKKTHGVNIVELRDRTIAFAELPLEQVWGIGPGLSASMRQQGLQLVEDIQVADTNRVGVLFGVAGTRKQAELCGTIADPVSPNRGLQKSLMSSKSFSNTTADKAVVQDALAYHVRQLAAALRSMSAVTGILRVSLQTSRHSDWLLRGGSREAALISGTNDTVYLLKIAISLLDDLYDPTVPYSKVGVTLSNIRPTGQETKSLFENKETQEGVQRDVWSIVDSLNAGARGEVITVGSRGKIKEWQSKSVWRSGRYTTHWGDLVTVSAS